MKDIEGKIKAFLSDEEKIKALANDDAFIEKVAGGTATSETYGEEFKKLGLDLSDKEPEKIKEAVDKIMSVPVEKLADGSLENVSGGSISDHTDQIIVCPSAIGIVGGLVGALGCAVASSVYNSKASKAMQKGDSLETKKYSKVAKNLSIVSAVCAGAGVAGIGTIGGWFYHNMG